MVKSHDFRFITLTFVHYRHLPEKGCYMPSIVLPSALTPTTHQAHFRQAFQGQTQQVQPTFGQSADSFQRIGKTPVKFGADYDEFDGLDIYDESDRDILAESALEDLDQHIEDQPQSPKKQAAEALKGRLERIHSDPDVKQFAAFNPAAYLRALRQLVRTANGELTGFSRATPSAQAMNTASNFATLFLRSVGINKTIR